MLSDGAQVEDGYCVLRVWCGELEGMGWDARLQSTVDVIAELG